MNHFLFSIHILLESDFHPLDVDKTFGEMKETEEMEERL